jgi:hypothetical protein
MMQSTIDRLAIDRDAGLIEALRVRTTGGGVPLDVENTGAHLPVRDDGAA